MWLELLARLFFFALLTAVGSTEDSTDRMLLPVEVLGEDGTTASRTVILRAAESASAGSLWLQVHGVRYAEQASVQVNTSSWFPLRNDTGIVAAPGRTFGGIGGGFATLEITLPLPPGTVVPGANTIRFRFNQSDGLASGYRVLAWNLRTKEGINILPSADFVEDAPASWSAPRPDVASIDAGRELWHSASLVSSALANSPKIQAHCADCHAQDGRDLKYFNFSNASIIARSRFHGLSLLEGEQIASYIRSLPLPNPGRPWNPPYQPGPGLDQQPIVSWAAGVGLAWVLDQDTDALPFLVQQGAGLRRADSEPPRSATDTDFHQLVGQITPELFRPDGNLNPREIPIVLQLPDWSQWLPRIHPKDAWGPAFDQSKFAAIYAGRETKLSLGKLLSAARSPGSDTSLVVPAFAQWTQARHAFLGRFVKPKTTWSPELANKVYSTQLWQLMKTWEITQEFALEGRGPNLLGTEADARTWRNSIPADTAPSSEHIPNGPAGVGGSGLTNEYLSASWYELQIVLNSGSHQHRDRTPVDWVYLIGQFRELQLQSHQPEPVRLLVAVTKALQSTDPSLGPDDYRRGWRPDRNIDPRILVSGEWASFFRPLPFEVRRRLAESLLAAWMDKTLRYPITQYLPDGPQFSASRYAESDISGGRVWQAAEQFRAAGVSRDLVERLQNWGVAYTDRAARLQYH